MELGGKKVTVVSRPVPNQQGIVSFDYSIFERRKRKTGTYDTNTCELAAPDRGYREFGVVINLIMAMQEAYSESQCYLMSGDKPSYMGGYAAVIRGLLGINPDFSHRANMWDMLLFLKNTEEYQNVTAKMIWDTYSFDLCQLNYEQFMAAYEIDSNEITVPQEPFHGGKMKMSLWNSGKMECSIFRKI